MRYLATALLAIGFAIVFVPIAQAAPSFNAAVTSSPSTLSIDTTYSATDSESTSMSMRLTNSGSTYGWATPGTPTGPAGITVTCTSSCTAFNYTAGATRTISYSVRASEAARGGTGSITVPFTTDAGPITQTVPLTVVRRDAALLSLSSGGYITGDLPCGGSATPQTTVLTLTNGGGGATYASASGIHATLGTFPSWLTASLSSGPTSLLDGASGSFTLTTTVNPGDTSLRPGRNTGTIPITVDYSTTRLRPDLSTSTTISVNLPVELVIELDGNAVGDPWRVDFGNVYPQSTSLQKFQLHERCGFRGLDIQVSPTSTSPLAGIEAPTKVPAGGRAPLSIKAVFSPGSVSLCAPQSWGYRVEPSLVASRSVVVTAQPAIESLDERLATFKASAAGLSTHGTALADLAARITDASKTGQSCQDSQLAALTSLIDPTTRTMDDLKQGRDAPPRVLAEAAALTLGIQQQCAALGSEADRQLCRNAHGVLMNATSQAIAQASDALAASTRSDVAKVEAQRALVLAARTLQATSGLASQQAARLASYEADLANNRATAVTHLAEARRLTTEGDPGVVYLRGLPIAWHPLALREVRMQHQQATTEFNAAIAALKQAGDTQQAQGVQAEAASYDQRVASAELWNVAVVAGWGIALGALVLHAAAAFTRLTGSRKVRTAGDFLARVRP